MKKKEEKENIVNELNETTINDESIKNVINAKNILMAKSHCDNAFSLLANGKKEEAKKEIEIAYELDENNAYVYLAKLYIKFNIKNYADLEKKASNSIISSSFFKAAYELGDKKLKDELNQISEEVEYKELELNLDNADVEQLLKHLRIQKSKEVDYTYTISLILGILYRSFRYIDTDYIDENLSKDNFVPILAKMESSFQYYMDILYHFDDISDIKDIIAQCVKDHKAVLSYLLIIFKKIIDNTNDQDKLLEIKEFLESTYVNHEADDLLEEIRPKIKKELKMSKKGLTIALSSLAVSLICIFVGVGVGASVNDAPITLNGVTYAKNDRSGFTIIGYDFDSNIVTFENEIDGMPVNMIDSDVFYDSSIQQVINFPKYITEIPASTFESCDFLTSFSFSEDSVLSRIGENAFKNCTTLETLEIPQFVSTIGSDAFLNTPNLIYLTKLTNVDFDEEDLGLTPRLLTIADSDYQLTYYSWDNITLPISKEEDFDFTGYQINGDPTDFKNVDADNEGVTFSCSGYFSIEASPIFLSALVITDQYGVTYQTDENREFYTIVDYDPTPTYSNRITLAYILNGIPVTQISSTAFQNNRSIVQVNNFPHFIKEIPENCFKGCVSLESFIFSDTPSELEIIGNNAFDGCSSLTSFTLPRSVKTIGDNAFANTENLVEFYNTYDFGENGQEAQRIGFEERPYTITYENGTTISGIYYNCEDLLNIEITPRENYRTVIINNMNEDEPIICNVDSSFYRYNVQGHSSLNLSLYYERYYDPSLYRVELDDNQIGEIVLEGNQISVPLHYIFRDNAGNLISNHEYNVEFVATDSSSQIDARVENNNLIITRHENSSERQQFIIMEVRIRGKYSNEIMLSSTAEFVNVLLR